MGSTTKLTGTPRYPLGCKILRATLAEKMSGDEEWTPPTEAELKVLDLSKSPMAIVSLNMGYYFLPI